MLHRLRESWADVVEPALGGTVEVDETYVGGKERNKHRSKRLGKEWQTGRAIVIGGKPRDGKAVATIINNVDKKTLQGFIQD